MIVLEYNNSNSIQTENCDTNEVVEETFLDNIDDEICSTCADELNLEEETKTIEENCTKCEEKEKDSKVDDTNFQLLSGTSEDQSTFQIDDENYTVVEDAIENTISTMTDELVLQSNLISINEENNCLNDFELNPIVTNDGIADGLELDTSDSTEPKSDLFDNSNQTFLKDDDESSFVPAKLDDLQDFSISNETQANGDEQNSINSEELNTIHAAFSYA